MPPSRSNRQAQHGRSVARCDHGDALDLSECSNILKTFSTAQSTDVFRFDTGYSRSLAQFIELCASEPCQHFKQSFLDNVWPVLCQASVRALQLLFSSSRSFQQQSEEVLLGACALLRNLCSCLKAIVADSMPSTPQLIVMRQARLARLLASTTTAGE